MPNSDHVNSSNGLHAADIAAMPNGTTLRGVAVKSSFATTAAMSTTLPSAKSRAAGTESGTGAASKKQTLGKQKRAPKATADPKQKKNSPGGAGGSKRRKANADPNQPKKPSNAFFWFCQEHRPSLQERFRGEGVQGQHDLTKILAKLWSETAPDDKKVCLGLRHEVWVSDTRRGSQTRGVGLRHEAWVSDTRRGSQTRGMGLRHEVWVSDNQQ